MHFLYILGNPRGHLYKGISNNIERRLSEHNHNHAIGTRGKGPWELIYTEKFQTRAEARKREKLFKSGIGREELNKLMVK